MKSINKTSAVLIAVLLAAVASLAFLIVEVTALFIAAYVFTLIAIRKSKQTRPIGNC
jgi:hypothetical protein